MSSDPTQPTAEQDLQAGQSIGEFQVTEKLARGGMGSVYAAVHPVIGKRAAIKVIHSDLCANPQAVKRFVDEARAVNQIGHPNIVDIFAFGQLADRRSYFIMEWLEGKTLTARLMDGDVPFFEAAHVLSQLCAALEAAHDADIIHRDIKPDNVQLVPSRSGITVKLLDFGIAKLSTSDEQRTTGPKMAIGTPDYISPEQACGEDVDRRSDIYSLGVLAYELFTGKRPFYGENIRAVMTKHVTADPPNPSEAWPEIPPKLERLLLAMLAKDPGDRPTIALVRQTLEELERSASLDDPGAKSGHLARRPMLRRRFGRLEDLARPLITDLSSGVTWARAQGTAPGRGAPIVIRYEVEDLSLALDFGGVVERQLGAEERHLVRFDRVPKSRLDKIFTLGASLPQGDEAVHPPQEEWLPPSAPVAPTSKPRRTTLDSGEAPAVETIVVSSLRAPVATTGGATAVAPPDEEVEIGPRKAAFGLGARFMILAIAIAVSAVATLTAISLERVRSDRLFYVDELVLRTARQIGDNLDLEHRTWTEILALVAANEGELKVLGEPFEGLARCVRRQCRTVKGIPPGKTILDAFEGIKEGRLARRALGGALYVGLAMGDALALGAVDPSSLVRRDRLPSEFGAWVAMPEGEAIVATEGARAWPPVAAWSNALPETSGTTRYEASDGSEMLLGWTRSRDLLVAVDAPASLAARAVRLLASNIAVVAVVVLIIAALIAFVFSRGMTRRLRKLTTHATRIGQGRFGEITLEGGDDEVGRLAESFNQMTSALRTRDAEVLKMRQQLSEEESRSLRRQISEWLEADLSIALTSMREVIGRPADGNNPQGDLRERKRKMEILIGRADAALENAFSRAAIATRRVDFGATIADAVDYARGSLPRDDVEIELTATNAVLFPRVSARESELREIVDTLLRYGCEAAPSSGGHITVSLEHREQILMLSIRYDFGGRSREAATLATEAVEPLLIGHNASATLLAHGERVAVVIEFPVDSDGPSAEPDDAPEASTP